MADERQFDETRSRRLIDLFVTETLGLKPVVDKTGEVTYPPNLAAGYGAPGNDCLFCLGVEGIGWIFRVRRKAEEFLPPYSPLLGVISGLGCQGTGYGDEIA